MSISPGYTNAEIREFVYEYERQPHGTKAAWITQQPFTITQLRRWQAAVFNGGDLERGQIARQSTSMPTSQELRRRTAKTDLQAKQETDLENLRARVAELETVNEALGKAGSSLDRVDLG